MSEYDLRGVKPRYARDEPLSVSFDASATLAGEYDTTHIGTEDRDEL